MDGPGGTSEPFFGGRVLRSPSVEFRDLDGETSPAAFTVGRPGTPVDTSTLRAHSCCRDPG